MAYEIQKSDGTTLVFLSDGFRDNSTSLTLVGRNYVGYGEFQNENFVFLLENFANTIPPTNPLAGQTWYDTNTQRLKVYDNTGRWASIPSMEFASSVSGQLNGDLWLNSSDQSLYAKVDGSYVKIGPFTTATSASSLASPVTINGVVFDGTSNITITAQTPGTLIAGAYITGTNFNGSTTATISVDTGNVTQATPNKVVARDGNGDIWFEVGHGTSTEAYYADLAEKYLTDKDYETGTVLSVGGEKEVTACQTGDRAIGVVSANPAIKMNSELENGIYVALKGRVPVKITGEVRKSDRLVAGPNGTAVACKTSNSDVFAIALEDSNEKQVIEAIVL